MSLPILSVLLGFLLGIIATIIVERIGRYFRLKDPGRKQRLANLQAIRKWMESYHCLFDATYPECPELVLAHKILSQKYPHYDKAAPLKLYDALKEYQALRTKHDELTRAAFTSMQALSNKHLDRIYGLNKKVSSVFQKTGLLKGSLLFPVSFSTDIGEHLKIIDQYREKVFEEFPHKVVKEIEWEKLDHIPPEQLSSIVHPQMKYFQSHEDTSRDREKESKLFDEMQNLSFYRIVAKKEIDQILSKIELQEEHYTLN